MLLLTLRREVNLFMENNLQEKDKSRLEAFIANPRRAIWTLAGPMMAGYLVHALYSIVDTIFIGRIGPYALAAGTFIMALFFIAIAISNGFATGVTAMVAQAIGRRDRTGADQVASNSLGMGLGIGLILGILGLIWGKQLIPLLGASSETAELGWQYFQVICVGMPIFFISASIRAVLTGEGNAKTPMLIMAMGTVLNLILDPILIFTLKMGISGAAWATVIAQGFALLAYCYVAFVKGKSFVKFKVSFLAPRTSIIFNIARIGIPTAVGMLIMSVAMALINRVVVEFGQTAVAGYGAGSRVDMLVALPVLGLASATVSVIGMFSGAKRIDLIKYSTLYTYKWVVILTTVLGIAAFLGSHFIIGLFNKNTHILEVGRRYLGYMVFVYPFMGIGMTSGRILQGLGQGVPSLVITAVRLLVIAVPGGYISVYLFNTPIDAIWISLISGGLVANIIGLLWIRRAIWVKDPTLSASRSFT